MATHIDRVRRPLRSAERHRSPLAIAGAVLLAAAVAAVAALAGGVSRADAADDGAAEPAGFFAIVGSAEIAGLISGMSGVAAVPSEAAGEPASAHQTPGHQEPLVFSLHEPSGRHYYLIGVAQALGGALFDEALQSGEIDAAADPDASPDASVFARVRDLPASAGPGGSTFGILFTTCDGRFDVRISASQSLPQDFSGQSVDVHLLARRLAASYSAISC
jgi:hypothetical protein